MPLFIEYPINVAGTLCLAVIDADTGYVKDVITAKDRYSLSGIALDRVRLVKDIIEFISSKSSQPAGSTRVERGD